MANQNSPRVFVTNAEDQQKVSTALAEIRTAFSLASVKVNLPTVEVGKIRDLLAQIKPGDVVVINWDRADDDGKGMEASAFKDAAYKKGAEVITSFFEGRLNTVFSLFSVTQKRKDGTLLSSVADERDNIIKQLPRDESRLSEKLLECLPASVIVRS